MPDALPPLIREAVSRYAAWLRQRFGARLRFARLYGSWARGDAHEESDIDVCVVVDDLGDDERREALREGAHIDRALGDEVLLGPLVLSTAQWEHLVRRERLIARDVQAQGIAL